MNKGLSMMLGSRLMSGAAVAALMVAATVFVARADTLADALESAYETNPTLISARASLRATDERVNQARAGLRPNVSATFDYRARYTGGNRGSGGSDDPYSASLDASQPLYDGGQTQNNVRGRIADVSAARARLSALEQQVLLETVTAYVDVLRDQEFVRLAENNVRVIAEQLRASQDRFEVGEVTRTDVSQAEARLADSRTNLSASRGRLERSKQNYRSVVGAEPQNLARQPPLPPLPQSMEEAVTAALENHPEMIATRFDETSASRDVKAQIGALLPRVSLEATVGYNDDGLFGSDSFDQSDAQFGVRAVIPLYQSGAQYSRVRQAQALASQARADITVEARQRQRLAEAAWTELEVARATIISTREQVDASQLAFEGVREEALVGSRTTLDVLDAEQELLDARVRVVDSLRNEYVAAYSLLSATGALTAADIGLSVVAYDPEVNYAENNARLFGFPQTQDTEWEELWRP
ncbi:MAG: secretion protein [Alphaproteobacteria bacterium HGW-Alphaproteobacteria-8]|nr:MAG: secretion protein [Alphaproteobacteria bacterium HGW-Alphaproteobacteria-8]